MKILEPALRRILEGYPNAFPQIIVHRNKEAYLASVGKDRRLQHSGGVHRPMADSIESFGQPRYELIGTLAHEAGHAIGQTSEQRILSKLVEFDAEIQQRRQNMIQSMELLEKLKQLRDSKDDERVELNDLILDAIRDYNAQTDTFGSTAFDMDNLADLIDPDRVSSQLDEAVAYLTEGLCMYEAFRDKPDVLRLLWKLRSFNNETDSVNHHGSYMLAEELLSEYEGNPLKAITELGYENSPEKLAKYRERIRNLNERDGIENSEFLAFPLIDGEPLDVRMRTSEMIDVLIEEGGRRKDEPGYPETLRNKIKKLGEEVAKKFDRYLQLSYKEN